MIGVDFNHRAFVDDDFMAGIVGIGKIRLIGMRHIRADHEAFRQRPGIILAAGCGRQSNAAKHIGQKTAVCAFVALAADFFMVEQRTYPRGIRLHSSIIQQRLQCGMTRSQVIQLAVRIKLAFRSPEGAFLRVVHGQIPG